ncbi:hypothetical protein [Acuticoccus sediminis]|uniref:hypothetical protein n=1 Tax=Acuticoccus sediminis TaxID=2184697 RepID=UPI00192E5EA1|nr:hypothetical protein [Acuticoccus sediminis]
MMADPATSKALDPVEAERRRRQRKRSVAIAVVLIALVLIFYAITILQMTAHSGGAT